MAADSNGPKRSKLGDLWLSTIVGATLGGIAMMSFLAIGLLALHLDWLLDCPAEWFFSYLANPVAGGVLGMLYGLLRLSSRRSARG